MPNTLAHIGVQGLATRGIIKHADYKWILIGCIIPDVPWMLRRVLSFVFDVNPYDLRLYAIVQSSLIFCLILSLTLATFSKRYWRTFAILGINSLLHLILDALQTKWGNGVNLLAPFSWDLTNFGLFWPESLVNYTLTAFGFIYFWMIWRKNKRSKSAMIWRPIPLILFLSVYVMLPFMYLSGPVSSDNHFIRTLRSFENRQGKYIEIDRSEYTIEHEKGKLKTLAGEFIRTEGISQNVSGVISIQGTFVSNNLIKVSKYHIHSVIFRDSASYVGLSLVIFYWIYEIFIPNRFKTKCKLSRGS